MDAGSVDPGRLSEADRRALRLGAQVMGHKALVDDRPLVAGYFADLEHEMESPVTALTAGAAAGAIARRLPASDRRLVSDYLGLLANNEQLPPAVRDVWRHLRERDGR